MTFRTVTVEDDRRYRMSLQQLLSATSDFSLAGSFGTAEAALERAERPGGSTSAESWDLVLMDLDLPGVDGIEATRRIKALNPSATVVVLTVFEAPGTVLEAICAGADGYLAKRLPPDELLEELRSVMEGGSPLSPGIARTVLRLLRELGSEEADPSRVGGPANLGLTEREREVLRCLVDGLPYKQAADELGISHNTVRSHVRSIYSKLQVQNVAQAVSRALREGLV